MANKLTKFPNNLIRGDTPLLQVPLTVNGNPANLTGYNTTFTVTASQTPVTGDTPVIQVSAPGDSTGILNFQLCNGVANNDTSKLAPGTTYYWDVQLSNDLSGSNRRIFTVLRGTLGVDADYNLSTS
jgi:hypothetical protein